MNKNRKSKKERDNKVNKKDKVDKRTMGIIKQMFSHYKESEKKKDFIKKTTKPFLHKYFYIHYVVCSLAVKYTYKIFIE